MHQAVLAQAVLDKALDRARSLGAERIIAVHVLLGEDDEHTEEALRFAWDEVSARTCAEGAEFVITTAPGDGLRLAAIDIDRTPAPDQRPSAEGGEDRLT
jgi:Zn finger protein HypA/HybF involved in hydrogenase expression